MQSPTARKKTPEDPQLKEAIKSFDETLRALKKSKDRAAIGELTLPWSGHKKSPSTEKQPVDTIVNQHFQLRQEVLSGAVKIHQENKLDDVWGISHLDAFNKLAEDFNLLLQKHEIIESKSAQVEHTISEKRTISQNSEARGDKYIELYNGYLTNLYSLHQKFHQKAEEILTDMRKKLDEEQSQLRNEIDEFKSSEQIHSNAQENLTLLSKKLEQAAESLKKLNNIYEEICEKLGHEIQKTQSHTTQSLSILRKNIGEQKKNIDQALELCRTPLAEVGWNEETRQLNKSIKPYAYVLREAELAYYGNILLNKIKNPGFVLDTETTDGNAYYTGFHNHLVNFGVAYGESKRLNDLRSAIVAAWDTRRNTSVVRIAEGSRQPAGTNISSPPTTKATGTGDGMESSANITGTQASATGSNPGGGKATTGSGNGMSHEEKGSPLSQLVQAGDGNSSDDSDDEGEPVLPIMSNAPVPVKNNDSEGGGAGDGESPKSRGSKSLASSPVSLHRKSSTATFFPISPRSPSGPPVTPARAASDARETGEHKTPKTPLDTKSPEEAEKSLREKELLQAQELANKLINRGKTRIDLAAKDAQDNAAMDALRNWITANPEHKMNNEASLAEIIDNVFDGSSREQDIKAKFLPLYTNSAESSSSFLDALAKTIGAWNEGFPYLADDQTPSQPDQGKHDGGSAEKKEHPEDADGGTSIVQKWTRARVLANNVIRDAKSTLGLKKTDENDDNAVKALQKWIIKNENHPANNLEALNGIFKAALEGTPQNPDDIKRKLNSLSSNETLPAYLNPLVTAIVSWDKSYLEAQKAKEEAKAQDDQSSDRDRKFLADTSDNDDDVEEKTEDDETIAEHHAELAARLLSDGVKQLKIDTPDSQTQTSLAEKLADWLSKNPKIGDETLIRAFSEAFDGKTSDSTGIKSLDFLYTEEEKKGSGTIPEHWLPLFKFIADCNKAHIALSKAKTPVQPTEATEQTDPHSPGGQGGDEQKKNVTPAVVTLTDEAVTPTPMPDSPEKKGDDLTDHKEKKQDIRTQKSADELAKKLIQDGIEALEIKNPDDSQQTTATGLLKNWIFEHPEVADDTLINAFENAFNGSYLDEDSIKPLEFLYNPEKNEGVKIPEQLQPLFKFISECNAAFVIERLKKDDAETEEANKIAEAKNANKKIGDNKLPVDPNANEKAGPNAGEPSEEKQQIKVAGGDLVIPVTPPVNPSGDNAGDGGKSKDNPVTPTEILSGGGGGGGDNAGDGENKDGDTPKKNKSSDPVPPTINIKRTVTPPATSGDDSGSDSDIGEPEEEDRRAVVAGGGGDAEDTDDDPDLGLSEQEVPPHETKATHGAGVVSEDEGDEGDVPQTEEEEEDDPTLEEHTVSNASSEDTEEEPVDESEVEPSTEEEEEEDDPEHKKAGDDDDDDDLSTKEQKIPQQPATDQAAQAQETATELLRLLRHYQSQTYLALHSMHDFSLRQAYLDTYTALHTELQKFRTADNDLGLTKTTVDIKNLGEEISGSPHSGQPKEIYDFAEASQIVNADKASELATKIMGGEELKSAESGTTLHIEPANARVTKLDIGDETTANVERWRTKNTGSQTQTSFITESYIPEALSKERADADALMKWACFTINRFFAAAPAGTKHVNFEDGYKPDQLAALISYCQFRGLKYVVGQEQTLRIQAMSGVISAKQFDAKELNRILKYRSFKMTPKLANLVADHPLPADWAITHNSNQFNYDNWKKWSDDQTFNQNQPITFLGKYEHDILMKKFSLVIPVEMKQAAEVKAGVHRPAPLSVDASDSRSPSSSPRSTGGLFAPSPVAPPTTSLPPSPPRLIKSRSDED